MTEEEIKAKQESRREMHQRKRGAWAAVMNNRANEQQMKLVKNNIFYKNMLAWKKFKEDSLTVPLDLQVVMVKSIAWKARKAKILRLSEEWWRRYNNNQLTTYNGVYYNYCDELAAQIVSIEASANAEMERMKVEKERIEAEREKKRLENINKELESIGKIQVEKCSPMQDIRFNLLNAPVSGTRREQIHWREKHTKEKRRLESVKKAMQRKKLQELESQTPSWDQAYAHQFQINLLYAQLQGRKDEVKRLKDEQAELRKWQALEKKAEQTRKRKERERKAIKKKAEQEKKRKARDEQIVLRSWSTLLDKEALQYVKELTRKEEQQLVKKKPSVTTTTMKRKATENPSMNWGSGVTFTKDHTWQARITYNGNQQYIGVFYSEEIALLAVKLVRDKLTTSDGSTYKGDELKQIIKFARDAAHAEFESRIAPLVAEHKIRKQLWREQGFMRSTEPSIQVGKEVATADSTTKLDVSTKKRKAAESDDKPTKPCSSCGVQKKKWSFVVGEWNKDGECKLCTKAAEEKKKEEDDTAIVQQPSKRQKNMKNDENAKPKPVDRPAQRSGEWSTEEHSQFAAGVAALGWSQWKGISEQYVLTRSATQVKTYAPTYLKKTAAAQQVTFQVQVPHGLQVGQQLQVAHPKTGKLLLIDVPQGVAPGEKFSVTALTTADEKKQLAAEKKKAADDERNRLEQEERRRVAAEETSSSRGDEARGEGT